MEFAKMSPNGVCVKLAEMESAILERGNEITSEEACALHNRLLSLYKGFTKSSSGSFNCAFNFFEQFCNIAYFVQKKVLHIEKILLRFFSPDYTISSTAFDEEKIDEPDLASLKHKQKFYMKLIDSLEPTGDLELNEAEIRSKHLDQYHKKFISNQSEITSLINGASFKKQVKISLSVQQRVREIEAKLKEISASASVVETAPDPKVNDQHVSDSTSINPLKRKQKFYMKMIDSLEPTGDLESKDAKVQSEHLNKYHAKFISNQCKIIELIEDTSSVFDDQVTISSQVQQKVSKILAKLNDTLAMETLPPATPSTKSLLDKHANQTKRLRIASDLLEQHMNRQKSLIEDIKLLESDLSQLYDTFGKNQLKIATGVLGVTLDDQFRISDEMLRKVKTLQIKLKEMFAPDVLPSADVSSREAEAQIV